jgi:2-polyprenyl-3-methyl-5-hydroxy-6-metoxy-1,4-benzoquinol methylase
MANAETTSRSCYVCGTKENPVIASEPSEQRFGRPVIPEGVYRFVRCRRCATLYVDSDVTDDYLSKLYEIETEEWVEERADRPEYVTRRLAEFKSHWADMKAARPPSPGDRLLDVGCQTGEFGSGVQRDGVVPNGVDLSPDYAARCRARWGSRAQVHCGPLATAPFGESQFQYISAFETLEHMCDPIGELKRLRRLISKDGVLAISVPSTNYFHFKFWVLRRSPVASLVSRYMARRSKFYVSQVLPHTHIYNFSNRSVRLMLHHGGFETILSKPTGWQGALLNHAASLLDRVSRRELSMGVSVFAIARPASPTAS